MRQEEAGEVDGYDDDGDEAFEQADVDTDGVELQVMDSVLRDEDGAESEFEFSTAGSLTVAARRR